MGSHNSLILAHSTCSSEMEKVHSEVQSEGTPMLSEDQFLHVAGKENLKNHPMILNLEIIYGTLSSHIFGQRS